MNPIKFLAISAKVAIKKPPFSSWGVYRDFDSARDAIPSHSKGSFDSEQLIDQYTSALAKHSLTSSDWFNLFALATHSDQIRRVVDFGGNHGQHYFAYAKRARLDPRTEWNVIELPAVAESGARIHQDNTSTSHLRFFSSAEKLVSFDLFFTSGALQFNSDFKSIVRLAKKSTNLIIISRVALTATATFATRVNIGIEHSEQIPEWIFNEKEFIGLFTDEFELVEHSKFSNESVFIPFHPKRCVYARSSLLFKKKQAHSPE